MIVGIISSVFAWMSDTISWAARLGFPAMVAASLGLLVWSLLRKEKLPDFLRQGSKGVFERDGFCFALVTRSAQGLCYIDVYFQSRYDKPSRAAVVLQPSKGFFLNRPGLASMSIQVDCPAGGYGVTSIPWAVAKKYQGKKQALDVAASVTYPEGRGKLIRYRGGVQVGPAGSDPMRVIMTVAGAMGGMIVLSRKARGTITLPGDVAETVDDALPITTEILWKLGDPQELPALGAKKKAAPMADV
jgi:hypothetical protein